MVYTGIFEFSQIELAILTIRREVDDIARLVIDCFGCSLDIFGNNGSDARIFNGNSIVFKLPSFGAVEKIIPTGDGTWMKYL